jgi:hypothetical protein
VRDVLNAPEGRERNAALQLWAEDVWRMWHDEHEQVHELARRFLQI